MANDRIQTIIGRPTGPVLIKDLWKLDRLMQVHGVAPSGFAGDALELGDYDEQTDSYLVYDRDYNKFEVQSLEVSLGDIQDLGSGTSITLDDNSGEVRIRGGFVDAILALTVDIRAGNADEANIQLGEFNPGEIIFVISDNTNSVSGDATAATLTLTSPNVVFQDTTTFTCPLPTYADNAAALGGGLVATQWYKTATGEVRIVV